MLMCIGCNTLEEVPPKTKDGRIYGKIPHFKHRWYHYYARGLSFAEGEFYSEACSDLTIAMNKRSDDQRNARTYGFHFIDYFPHRELGVIYYRQKKIKDAIDQLEISLSTEKSARAEYYLDLARKDFIQSSQLDHHPPEIIISSPKQTKITNIPNLTIQGYVTDDTYVKHIDIEKRQIRMDLSQKKKTFLMNLPLKTGQNDILIQAIDIMGKTSHFNLHVLMDRSPPMIGVENVIRKENGNKIDLKITAFDSNGLDRIVIGKSSQDVNGVKQAYISKSFELSHNQKNIQIKVCDQAGNWTHAEIPINNYRKSHVSNQLLAGDFMTDQLTGRILISQKSNNHIGKSDSIYPEINLPREKKVTFLDYMYLEGSIKDNVVISHLSINGKNILPFEGKKIFFNHLIPLKTGKNIINLSGMDAFGHSTGRTLQVTRLVPEVEQLEARLKVAIASFKRVIAETISSQLKDFENDLYREMKKKQRFFLIHPEKLNVEKKFIYGQDQEIVDEIASLVAAKKLHADYVMFGKITEHKDRSMSIYIRLVDTELPDTIEDIAVDVYTTKNIDRDQLVIMAQGLNFKLADEIPLVKGNITRVLGSKIKVDIGLKDNIKKGMKLIVYHIEKITDPKTDVVIWEEFSNNGQARIESLQDEFSMAKLLQNKGLSDQKAQQQIITK